MATNTDRLIRFLLPQWRVRGCMLRGTALQCSAATIHGINGDMQRLFGQTMIGAVLMLSMSKGGIRQVLQLDAISEQVPVRRILAEVQSGHVRGYINWQEEHSSSLSKQQDLACWMGTPLKVSVVRDLGQGQPYISTIESSAEYLADHLTHFSTQSIQTRADFVLHKDVGIMLEAMPGCDDTHWHQAITALANISNQCIADMQEAELQIYFADSGIKIVGHDPWQWHCHCQPERMAASIAKLPEEQWRELTDQEGNITVTCQYCRKSHRIRL